MQETKEWDTPGGSSKSGEGGDRGLAFFFFFFLQQAFAE